ncbi:MAG TPA: hypothetical protein VGF14_01510, partial [Alphaproteobacteria bacterium]
ILFTRSRPDQGMVNVPGFTALQDVLEAASLNHIPVWHYGDWSDKTSLFKAMAAGSQGLLVPLKDNNLITPWVHELRVAIGQTGARSAAELPDCAHLATIS